VLQKNHHLNTHKHPHEAQLPLTIQIGIIRQRCRLGFGAHGSVFSRHSSLREKKKKKKMSIDEKRFTETMLRGKGGTQTTTQSAMQHSDNADTTAAARRMSFRARSSSLKNNK
jgi:hypothetical protein